ncbi:MFS transporter [Streptomyces sulphureus]|uniref:MFS transporter n=1 Tax=Streptomyces sulphureus TaxID=47758 RepID=UPI00036A9B29|nr:MFS transporter [Streptomyces sulphureus]
MKPTEAGTPGDSPALPPDAAAPPRTASSGGVGPLFVTAFAAAYCGIYVALVTPTTVTLAMKVHDIAPDRENQVFSLVLGVGSVLAILGNPLFGRLSDRTVSRLGMRKPWLLGGSLAGALGILLVVLAEGVPLLLLGWCLAQLGFNAVLAALVALLPDQVPVEERGRVSGALGLCLPVALVIGSFLAQVAAPSVALMFLLPTAVGVVTVVALALLLRDRHLSAKDRPPFTVRGFLQSYWVNPVRQPDFGWAWLSRFLMFMGTSVLSAYKSFYLMDHFGFRASEVPRLVFLTLVAQAVVTVVTSQACGRLSDRLMRRKIFVLAASAVYGVGLALVAFAGSFGVFVAAVALCGVGFGAYLSVDLALVADVLPSRETAARDLGVFNIANALPQTLAPALAPAVLGVGGGDNYPLLFLLAACSAMLGAVAVQPIRGVR